MAAKSNGVRIIAKNDDERMTVVLPVPAHRLWPAENIAFFCSTGQSGVKVFSDTYFPTFGVYVDDTTPIPDIDRSITLVKNYFVKISSVTFLKSTADKMQEWIYTVLRNYYESRGMSEEFQFTLDETRDIMDVTRLKQLVDMYKEMDLIYRCLSSYFTALWQVHYSVCLSDTFQSGVWLSELKEFGDYIKLISVPRSHRKSDSPRRTPKKTRSVTFTITDNAPLTSDNIHAFLVLNGAQCDFTRLRESNPIEWYKTRTSHMHDSLFKNLQSVEMGLRIAAKVVKKGGTRKNKKRKTMTKYRRV